MLKPCSQTEKHCQTPTRRLTTIEMMLDTGRAQALRASALTMLVGKRYVRPKHEKAWRRVAHFLQTGQTWDQPGAPDETQNRQIYEGFVEEMRRRWPHNPTAWSSQAPGAHTNLYTLSGMHHSREAPAVRARDTAQEYMEGLALSSQPRALTSLRRTVQVQTPTVNKGSKTGYAQFLEAYNTTEKRRDMDRLAELSEQYSHTRESIVGVKSLCNSRSQNQAIACWDSCIQPGWQIELQKQAGYRCTQLREATPADLARKGADAWRPCEYCTAPTDVEENAVQCCICQRKYHRQCVLIAEEITPVATGYTCAECVEMKYSATLPPDLKLYYVEWEPQGETFETIQASGTQEAHTQLEELRERQQHREEPAPKRAHVEVSRRSVMPADSERVYDITLGQQVRKKLVIHTQPINPHADIAPTGSCQAYFRRVLHGNSEHETDMCCVYGVDGRCEHLLQPEVAACLHQAYVEMQHEHPRVLQDLQVGTFAEELRRLMLRYKTEGTTRAEQARHWGIPEGLKHALMCGIKAETERFASPLTVHPCTKVYWTAHRRDQVFGANFDADSTRWTGRSLAVPEYTMGAAIRAVDWTIRSAMCTTVPTLTLVLVPTYFTAEDDTKYMQLIRRNPAHCLPICTFKSETMQLKPPAAGPLSEPVTLKWRFRLVAIGNDAGYAEYFNWPDEKFLSGFQQSVREACPTPEGSKTPSVEFDKARAWKNVWEERQEGIALKWARKASRRFEKRPPDTQRRRVVERNHPYYNYGLRWESVNTVTPTGPPDREPLLEGMDYAEIKHAHSLVVNFYKWRQGAVPPLLHDWTQFVYTDGSHIQADETTRCAQGGLTGEMANQPTQEGEGKAPTQCGPGVGTGVYIHGHPAEHIHCKWEGPDADPQCNTITRAELAGIDQAIRDERGRRMDGTTHIATDSLSSIYAIAKAATRPQDLVEHRHAHVLQGIVRAIQDAPGTVHIWKVKSHIGIVGNEKADAAAVGTAKGESPPTRTFDAPSHERHQIHWPSRVDTHQAKGGTLRRVATPLADMHTNLKNTAHASSKLGGAHTDGIYPTAWRAVDPQIDHTQSHRFLSYPGMKFKQIKRAMQYRWGRLPTNNWLNKIGKSPTNLCPLCGEPDGGHHVVSGCQALRKAYIQRHNAAGTEILEAISQGTKGHCVMMSDVGYDKRRSPAEIPENMQQCRFISHATFPPLVSPELEGALLQYKSSVPDMLLIEERGCSGYLVLIVEIKYCRDTDPGPQREKAQQQHAALKDLIEKHGRKDSIFELRVHIVPLILGASGVIYSDFKSNLSDLGVTGTAANALCKRLHSLAIGHLNKIWEQRTAMTRGRQPRDKPEHRNEHRQRSRKRPRTKSAPSVPAKRPASAMTAAPDHRKRRRKR